MGEHDLSKVTDAITQDIPVVKTVKHPDYNMRDGNSDLAVVYLAFDAVLSDRVRTICLPLDNEMRMKNYIGYQMFVAGWGRLSEGGQSADVLQELQIPILDNEVCKERFRQQRKLLSERQFNDAVVCAGVLTGGEDSCQGK